MDGAALPRATVSSFKRERWRHPWQPIRSEQPTDLMTPNGIRGPARGKSWDGGWGAVAMDTALALIQYSGDNHYPSALGRYTPPSYPSVTSVTWQLTILTCLTTRVVMWHLRVAFCGHYFHLTIKSFVPIWETVAANLYCFTFSNKRFLEQTLHEQSFLLFWCIVSHVCWQT